MTPTEYRAEIAALGLSQIGAAKVIGVDPRTSRRYALKGVPERISAWVKGKLDNHAANVAQSERETDIVSSRIGTNTGHGHAWKRPDGVKMRCGGVRLCAVCNADYALVCQTLEAGKVAMEAKP